MSERAETTHAGGWAATAEDFTMSPVAERRVPDALAARLEQLIHEGKIVPGERLPPERELAALFSVSRSSMREALNQLVMKGLISRRPGRGTLVLDRDSSHHNTALRALGGLGADVSDALDFRLVIEPAIAAQAARRASRADVIRLEEVLRFMEHDGSTGSFATLDRQFHELIARACHNPLLVALSDLAAEWMEATRHEALQTEERREASRRAHREIFHAIAQGDADAAEGAMARHVRDVAEILRTALGGDREA